MAVHVDIIAELQKRSVDKATTELERSFNNVNAPIGVDIKAAEIKAAAEKIRREFSDIRAHVGVDVDRNSFGQAARGFKDVENAARGAGNIVEELGKTAFRTSRGLLAIGAPVAVDALIQIAEVGTAATQALWLLPAAATAAAAGMGTLALATSGFADTIKDIRDPKKFAADIQMLSPAAQQAALSIQNLLPAFDKLQHATQDALFAGMGEQINRLATTYLPSIQNLTTSIAGSFNNMLNGVANQLMTPETQASMQTMFANITQMFQNLAPAAAPIVKALTDIATVGSGFLPGLATSITNAANSFAIFISNARESGQLATWIQQGIDAVKNLGTAAWELIQIWYRVFGPETKAGIDSNIVGVSALKETVASYGSDLMKISDIIGLVVGDTETWSTKWNEEMLAMQGPLGQLRDGILDIPEAFAYVTNKAIDMANNVKHVLDKMAQNAAQFVDNILPGDQSKNFTPLPDIPHVPPGGDWKGYTDTAPPGAPTGPYSNQGYNARGTDAAGPQKWTNPATGQRMVLVPRLGWVPEGDPRAANPGNPAPGPLLPVPPAPPGPAGAKPSDRERLDAIRAGLDPSLYHVDPFAPVPGMPSPGALAGGPMPGGGYGAASGQEFFEGQQQIINQAHQLEEKRKDRLALERDNQSTAEQINDAKWQEHQAEVDLQKAQAALVDKTKGTAQDLKTSTEALSAGLDPDLGLSKGLAGLADNLVRFAGHMALAGPMAQLNQTVNANAAATGITGGYGLLGISGAQNLSQGLSPLLGNPMPTDGTGTPTAAPSLGSAVGSVPYGLSAGTNTGGYGTGTSATFPPWVMALAQQYGVTPSTYPGHQETDRNEPGYAPNPQHLNRGIDWSGTPEAMQRFAQAMAADPLAEQVIYNGATPIEAVAGQARPGYYADELAKHGGHVHTRFSQDPTGGLNGDPTATGYGGGTTSFGGGSIPIPLPVTIVGGGAGSGIGIGGGATPTLGGGTAGNALGGGAGLPRGSAAGGAESWRNTVRGVIAKYGPQAGITANNAQAWEDAIVSQIDTESKGDPGQDNPNDSNGQGGRQHVSGLLQYLPSSYAASGGQLTGLPYMDPVGQIAGALMAPRTASGAPDTTAPGGIGAGHGWGPTATPLSGGIPAVGGGTAGGPGPSMPTGGALGTVPPTQYGGVEPPSNPGGGGMGITPGGTIDSAMQMAASAFPGVGQAAATGMKLANRAIQYGGQMAGIGVEGLMQTFLPTGGSELASNSWLTRLVGGLAGASPALPNMAGKQTKDAQQQAQGPLTPQMVAANGNPVTPGPAPGPGVVINYANNGATEDRAGADIAHHIAQQNQPNAVAGHR